MMVPAVIVTTGIIRKVDKTGPVDGSVFLGEAHPAITLLR